MKKIYYKLFQPTNDLEVALNKEGSAGWEVVLPLMTPAGPIFVMKQVSDEDVTASDIEAARKAAHEAELMEKFGPSGPRLVKQ